MTETSGIETGYSLEELRETLLDDQYFMECVRDAAERVPQASPFPCMQGDWFDNFFDSEYDYESEEHHGYRWAMREAETRDEIFEAVKLVFDHIGFTKEWPGGRGTLAKFEYHSQRHFGYGCSFPQIRYSIHEIGGVYFAWYFRFPGYDDDGLMAGEFESMCGSMSGDDGHDERVGDFWLTFEDALEHVCSMVDADLELEQREYEEKRSREAAEEGGDGYEDDDGWDDEEDEDGEEESPEIRFELSRSFAEHVLGRGARIIPARLHPGHNVNRRFPAGHRLLREKHDDMSSAEGWAPVHPIPVPVIDMSLPNGRARLPLRNFFLRTHPAAMNLKS